MKNIITKLSKTFENRYRLSIMSMLMVNDWVDYNHIKDLLPDLSDGNLASHIKHLEKQEYLEVRKQFIGKKPNTSYSATLAGRKAFQEHLDALEELIKQSK
ncbi:MAG: transcriptional regulator [Bacteroidota bacterium]